MAAGIREMFGEQICYSYYDGSAESALAAVQDLSAHATDNGPFDVVLGFFLGATLAATLLLRDTNNGLYNFDRGPNQSETFKCAILVCGTLPCDWYELMQRNMKVLNSGHVKPPVRIPTVHIWSPEDTSYPG